MFKRCASALALAAFVGTAHAQTVELRIVQESEIDSSVQATQPHTPSAPTRSYAVQARVNGGPALGGFVFDIVIPGEPDSAGSLARLRIQDAEGHYYAGPSAPTSAGGSHVGMAYQFSYLAGISASFNGLINLSGGAFTNSPTQQEIGNMTGAAVGAELLATPGMDPLQEGNPSTWAGYGVGAAPAYLETAPLDPAMAAAYFAAGQFNDVYRFRYTITSTAPRTLNLTIRLVGVQTFSQLVFNSGQWGAQSTILPSGSVSVAPLFVAVESVGACCVATHCSSGSAADCALSGGAFQGETTACGPIGNPTMCCRANFDGINGVQVQDIFDFLNAWFAGDLRADMNGGGLQVQDIFDFLNGWFAGCP